MKGRVYLVGAGPGDPELLTLKALRVLGVADVVLYDELVSREILELVPATACVHNVGKRCGTKVIRQQEIEDLMVGYASAGYTVVRLKGGDPLIFGRAGEEIAALRGANISFEVVPGVTAALGAAAAAQIALTKRHVASALTFVAYSRAAGEPPTRWRALIESGTTLALYMPGDDYEKISVELLEAGLHEDTPCVLISCATTPAEQIHATTLEQLAKIAPLPSPTLIVIGAAARLAAEHTTMPAEVATGLTARMFC
jgi:uroporphyrin-III C-methyltransferase